MNSSTFRIHFLQALIVSGALLSLPALGMLFTNEVNWSGFDFVLMASLLTALSAAYGYLSAQVNQPVTRVGIMYTVLVVLFMTWANLGVGLIASGPNLGNLLFAAVPLLGLVPLTILKLSNWSLALSNLAMCAGVAAVGMVSIQVGLGHLPGHQPYEIVVVCATFVIAFGIGALLFLIGERQQLLKSGLTKIG